MDYRSLIMATSMKACTRMANLKALEPIRGQMARFIKGNLRMDFALEVECGSTEQRSMKVHISMIKETGKGCIIGQEGAFTGEILLRI